MNDEQKADRYLAQNKILFPASISPSQAALHMERTMARLQCNAHNAFLMWCEETINALDELRKRQQEGGDKADYEN